MCDEKQNECRDHGDPPWEGPQVIPAQLRRVDNLIFRKINQFARCSSGTLSGSFPLPAPP